jgi:hypothetical protein
VQPNHVAPQRLSRSALLIDDDAAPHDVARSARIAVRLILASIAVLGLLQVIALPTQDPLRGTISGLVYAPAGGVLFAVMGALCVAGSVILAVSLARLGARKAAAAVWIWCFALTVASVVPTDPPNAIGVSLAAEIHRDAAAVMFAVLPIAALLVAHRFHRSATLRARRALRRSAVAAAMAGALQLPMSIPSLFPGTTIAALPAVNALYAVRGLAERALFVALLFVLIRTAAVVTRVASVRLPDAELGAAPRADRGGYHIPGYRSAPPVVESGRLCHEETPAGPRSRDRFGVGGSEEPFDRLRPRVQGQVERRPVNG